MFEGIDGTGKGAQIALAEKYLLSKGLDVIRSKDPGGTPLGQAIRDIMYKIVPTKDLSTGVVDLLFLASHLQNWQTVVMPALLGGKTVISDRWWYSQEAYGTERDVPASINRAYEQLQGQPADLMIFLHSTDVKMVVDRARARETETHQSAKTWNDYDKLDRIQQAYCSMYSNCPEWWPISVCGKDIDQVWVEVQIAIDFTLSTKFALKDMLNVL